MKNYNNQLVPSFSVLPTPKEYAQVHHPVLYDIQVSAREMSLTIWHTKKIVTSITFPIQRFESHVGMCSGYLRTATDRYNTTKKQLAKEEQLDFLEEVIHDVGEQVWKYVHNTTEASDLWELFMYLVNESQKSGIILARGKNITTWPIECMAVFHESNKHGLKLSVIKRIADEMETHTWPEWLLTDLPPKIVFLKGPNPPEFSGITSNLNQLDVEKEIEGDLPGTFSI